MAATAERIDRDHYAVLGVPETATDREITRAYRRLARELHPDTGGESADGARFREVADAYAVLHAPGRRREYDRAQRSARMSGAVGRTHGTPIRVNRRRPSRRPAGGLGDPVGDGFADVPADGRGRWAPRARRGADLAADLELSFEEAVRGTTSRLHVGDRTAGHRRDRRPAATREPAARGRRGARRGDPRIAAVPSGGATATAAALGNVPDREEVSIPWRTHSTPSGGRAAPGRPLSGRSSSPGRSPIPR